MADQANIMNMLQSNVADFGPFAHDNRFTGKIRGQSLNSE